MSTLLVTALLLGCDNDIQDASAELQGRWLNCYLPESRMGVELVFHGASWEVYSSQYSDSECENRIQKQLVEQGEFIVGEEFESGDDVDASPIDLTARFGNIDNYKVYYDLFLIEDDILYFGSKTKIDLSKIENRPTEIDFDYVFNKS